jgi:hypothetical protein
MLLGLLGLSVPVIIHLIQRQRLQPRMLSTLRFLDDTDASNAFAPVPRDLFQLLMRLFLLLLLLLAMVRLTVSGSQTGTRALALVVDGSMSMQRRLPTGRTLFERQKEQVLQLIDGMNEDDQFSVMLVGDEVEVDSGFLRDKEALREIVEGFEASEGGSRGMVPATKRAVQQLRSLREPNTAALVFSDHQRAHFEPYLEDEELRDLLAEARVKLLLVGKPPEDRPNVAVETAEFSPSRVYLGTSSKMTATVRNYSDEERNVEVYFSEGESTGEPRALRLGGGEAAKIDLAHLFESPADTACRVGISEDVLPADNEFHTPMRVRDRRQVLLVADPRKGEEAAMQASYAGADLVAYAINPGEALGLGTGTHVSTKRVTPNFLGRVSLPLYDTAIIYGIDRVAEKSISDLVAYVENGGSLYLIPEGDMSPSVFNQNMAPLLGGFRLGGWKEPAEPAFVGTNEAGIAWPVLLPLIRGEWGEVEDVTFSAYFDVHSQGAARPALQASNGDWLAAYLPRGRGGIYVQTFSCSIEDSSLPRSTAFVPMIQALMRRLSPQKREVEPDVIRVNEVARMELPELRNMRGSISLEGPEEYEFPLSEETPGEARVEGIGRAGNYRIRHEKKRGMRPRWLAVNPATGESDLTVLSADEQKKVFGKDGAKRLGFAAVASEFTNQRELFPWIMVVLFGAFALEALTGAWLSTRRREQEGV